MFVCEDVIQHLAVNLLKLIWDVRPCMHLHASSYMQRMAHNRLRKVWSKLHICSLLDGEYDVVCVLDTDTMAVRSLDEVFQNEGPAAVFRGSNTGNLGARRPSCTYGTIVVGQRQIGGISGGVVLYRPSQTEFAAMMDFLYTHVIPSKGAEHDFLTDFWKERYPRGINALPRGFNMQIHIAMLTGHLQSRDCW
jgi:hypothetical protein